MKPSPSSPPCPICRAPAVVRHRHAVETVAAAHTPPARDAERYRRMLMEVRRLWPAGFVEACTCERCQLGFASPMVEGDAAFYELLHERAGYPRERWEFRFARENVVGTTGRVLDVGAGRGDFLASLPPGVKKHAVEASASLITTLGERGISAHTRLISAASASPFDVVTMFHVLQYFADPVAAIMGYGAMLKRGSGRLLISIPNASAGSSIEVLPSPPHPLTRWTRTALGRAITAAGLEVAGFMWIPQRPASLLWAANAQSRARAVARPTSISGRIDALPRGRVRTTLLTALAMTALPAVLLDAPALLKRSQCLVIARPSAGPRG